MVSVNTSLDTAGVFQAQAVGSPLPRDQQKAAQRNGGAGSTRDSGVGQLTPDQQRQVERLQQTDKHVHEHEQAHLRAGTGLITSGPSYTYTYSPDGKAYATGGEVGIDTSPEKTPQGNVSKGRHIQAAALAPSDPSAQDYQVANAGSRLEAEGRTELAAAQRAEIAAQLKASRVGRAYGADAGAGSSLSLYA